jgi:MoaA/NifB/PqqE/SkfB family radical SAM enzyme
MSPKLKEFVTGKIITDHNDGPTDGTPWDYTPEQMEYIKSIYVTGKQPEPREIHKGKNIAPMIYYNDNSTERMNNPFVLVNNWQHSFTGWECSAGRNGIAISFDGYAYAGNCRTQRLGRLGTFDLLSNPIICPNRWCKTAADIQLNKRYIEPGSVNPSSPSAQALSTQL